MTAQDLMRKGRNVPKTEDSLLAKTNSEDKLDFFTELTVTNLWSRVRSDFDFKYVLFSSNCITNKTILLVA